MPIVEGPSCITTPAPSFPEQQIGEVSGRLWQRRRASAACEVGEACVGRGRARPGVVPSDGVSAVQDDLVALRPCSLYRIAPHVFDSTPRWL